jgi:CBS domain containing-hemolysin-like protein
VASTHNGAVSLRMAKAGADAHVARPTQTAMRYAGAAAVVGVGAVHAQQYYDAYFSVVPVIGSLFLLSFIGSGLVAATLLAPVRRLGPAIGDVVLVLAALGGIGIALGSLVSLLVSEYAPLFGFMESGYRLAIVLAIVFDALATVFLGAFVALIARAWHQPRTPR